ncbi:MAG: extracellular solute-binding protein, partial [Eubacteriales bacterium]|nr:extracellular solute-binding protein [Eubacteriales bacterium]
EPIYYSAMNSVTTQNNTGKWDELNYFVRVGELTNVFFNFANITQTDYDTKMNLSLASGEIYDIYMSGVGADNIRTYGVESGVFAKLNDLIANNMPELVARNEELPLMFKAVTETDGSIYSFPQYVETATIAVATVYTRLDYTEKVGYDLEKINALKDLTEVYDLMKAVQEDNVSNPDFVTLLPYSAGHLGIIENYFFPAFGEDPFTGYVENGDGTIHHNYTSEQYREYLTFMNKLFSEKILYNELYTADTATTTAITKANNAAFMSYATMLGYDNFASGNLDMTILPLVTSEYTDTLKCKGYSGVSNSGRVISATCEQPEILCRFLDINYSKDDVAPGINGLTNWLGVRGETWDYTDDSHEFYSVLIPEGVDLSATEYIYSYNGPSMHSWCSLMAIQKGASPGLTCKGLESLEKLYPYHVAPFPSSYLKYTSDESDRYTTLNTEITEYLTSMQAKFISGAESLDNWDNFVSVLGKMGIEELTSYIQAAYTRYYNS